MDLEKAQKKAAKRQRQRLRRKEKALENSLKESQSAVEQEGDIIKMNKSPEKTKEQILMERQAKKSAKQQGKKTDTGVVSPKVGNVKPVEVPAPIKQVSKVEKPTQLDRVQKAERPLAQSSPQKPVQENEKNRDQVHAEREAKKLAKQAAKKKVEGPITPLPVKQIVGTEKISADMEKLHITNESLNLTLETSSKSITKAERRAIQEAQRAAKVKALEDKRPLKTPVKKLQETKAATTILKMSGSFAATPLKSTPTAKVSALHKVKLFKHLYADKCDLNINVNHAHLHPAIIRLGLQFTSDSIVGSNARCYAFLNAMKVMINDYVTPAEKVFSRGLEAEIQPAIEFLQKCRPFAVSMTNALKYIKVLISLENSNGSDDDKKQRLIEKIATYAFEQIEVAAIAISLKVREKISNGDVILTYGCSSLIKRTLVEAWEQSELKFRVVVVDSRPDYEGQEMLKSLTMRGINCTYVLINAISFVMPEVTKVFLGAHALLANGYVMSRVGTAQIALIAKSYNVPVLVCCETHKFSERVQTDAFVFNEIGDPNALITNKNSGETFDYIKDWESMPQLTPLNLRYDFTPPELVTAVVTEVAILPCTSVQVILRVKPAE